MLSIKYMETMQAATNIKCISLQHYSAYITDATTSTPETAAETKTILQHLFQLEPFQVPDIGCSEFLASHNPLHTDIVC